jgi:DNA-binding SARP family transcriptional activator
MPRRVNAPPAARLAIRLLGPLEIIVAGAPIVVDTRKALAIVALVAAEGRPYARDELAAMFWPEADDEAARGALRRTLSSLRTAVGDAG